jgi:hypothetical protein
VTYDEIRKMPTVIDGIPLGAVGVHESVLRGYQILQKVKWLLEVDTQPGVIMELVHMMEREP